MREAAGDAAVLPRPDVVGVCRSDLRELADDRYLRRDFGYGPRLARYIQICDETSARIWSGLTRQLLPDVWSGMRTAHTAMRGIEGMSTPFLEELRRSAEHVAGIPFKIGGSGGGGALVAVCRSDDREMVDGLRGELAVRFPSTRLLSVHGADS